MYPNQQPYDDIFIAKITMVGTADVNGYTGHGFTEQRIDSLYGTDASHPTFFVDHEIGRSSFLQAGAIVNPAIELNKKVFEVGTLVYVRILGHFSLYGDVYVIVSPRSVLDVTCSGGTLTVTRM